MVGRTIGRYRVTALLGKGGMGEVWRADDALLGRPVALKFLPEGAEDEDRRRFLRGLKAAADLSHPGIGQVHDTGQDGGRPYGVLEFIDGETLSQRLEHGPIPVGEAVRIVLAAVRALGHAHDRGVLHRDVKSANIMIARDGRVVVVDFGLAWRKDLSQVTKGAGVIGTPGYMAPEVVADQPVDARSDLYSLAVVLYELLTGTTPLGGAPGGTWLERLLHEPAPPPSVHRAGLPTALDALVLRGVDKDPDRRFQSAEEMAVGLEGIGAGMPTPAGAPPVRPGEAPGRLPERKFVAVHPFTAAVEGNEADGGLVLLAVGLAEAASVGLGRLAGVRVFPPVAPGANGAGEDPASAAARTGANLAVAGTLRREGAALRLRWWLLQPATGMQLAAGALTGTRAMIGDLEEELVTRLAEALGLADDSGVRTRPMTRDPVAHERYLQALGNLRRYESEAAVDGAIAILERLAAADDIPAAYPAALGRAFLHKHRITSHSAWLHRAASACERAIAMDAEDADVLLTLAEMRDATGRHGEAAATYRRVLDVRPQDLDAWVGLSRALEGDRRLAEAEDAARRAVAIRPDHWPAYNRLGVLFFRQSRYERAVEAWREVTRLSPDNGRGWYNLGAAYFRSDRFDEALAAYRHSLEIGPSARAYTGEGTVLFYSGQVEEAVERFEKARALSPEDPVTWGDLGTALVRLAGREEEAVRALEHAVAAMRQRVALNPGDAEGRGLLASWLGHLGRLDEAEAEAARALELDPEDGAHMVCAAFVAARRGERDRAVGLLRSALARGYGAVAIRSDPVLGPLVRGLEDGQANGGTTGPDEIPPMEKQSERGGAR